MRWDSELVGLGGGTVSQWDYEVGQRASGTRRWDTELVGLGGGTMSQWD